MGGDGGSGRGQRGGGGGVNVQLETKSIAKEVRGRNSVKDSSHTTHSTALHPHCQSKPLPK